MTSLPSCNTDDDLEYIIKIFIILEKIKQLMKK